MSEDFTKGVMFGVAGLVIGGALGALGGWMASEGLLPLPAIYGFGVKMYLILAIVAVMGLITNGLGGLIGGLVIGAVLGGVTHMAYGAPLNVVNGWIIGSIAGIVSGLVGAMIAPPESKVGQGRGR